MMGIPAWANNVVAIPSVGAASRGPPSRAIRGASTNAHRGPIWNLGEPLTPGTTNDAWYAGIILKRERSMPVISMFYGLIVMLYFFDDKRHYSPRIHVKYAEGTALLAIPSGEVLAGAIPASRLKLVQAWTKFTRRN